jgi:hypothetical protein
VSVVFEVDCWTEVRSTPFLRALKYAAPTLGAETESPTVAMAAQTSLDVGGVPVELTIVTDEKSQVKGVALKLKEPRPNDQCPCGSGTKFKKCCAASGRRKEK